MSLAVSRLPFSTQRLASDSSDSIWFWDLTLAISLASGEVAPLESEKRSVSALSLMIWLSLAVSVTLFSVRLTMAFVSSGFWMFAFWYSAMRICSACFLRSSWVVIRLSACLSVVTSSAWSGLLGPSAIRFSSCSLVILRLFSSDPIRRM